MIAKTDTQHYSDIADSVRYSLDGTQYESSLAQARAQFAALVQRTITTASDSNTTSIGYYAFTGCTSLTSVNFPNATSIGNSAFNSCTNLTSVNFPNATSIGNSAFTGCTSLTSVNFPNVTSIDGNAFESCTSLTSVNFPNVTSINWYAFYACSSLTTANFPNVTSIDYYAFDGCSRLSTIILHKRATLASTNAIPSQTIVYVENSDLDWYSTATNWSAIYANGRIKSIDELPPTGGLT